MRQWKTNSRSTLFTDGKFLTVERHQVELPDGRIIPDWAWIITPDYVNVLAVTDRDTFPCFRQTKYAIEGISLAPAGGYLERGEDPLVAGQRELLEETGYEASNWIPLGHFAVDGNRGAGNAHLYLAQNARKVAEPCCDDLEEQILVQLTRDEIEAALAAGEFKVLAWAALVALGLHYLERQGK